MIATRLEKKSEKSSKIVRIELKVEDFELRADKMMRLRLDVNLAYASS